MVKISQQQLPIYANVIHGKGAPLEKCCTFVYGTAGTNNAAQENQRIIGNGNNVF